MITLKRQLDIQRFQVKLEIEKKELNNPLLSVLILTNERMKRGNALPHINEDIVKSKLLPTLPKRASKNLLERLKKQGYYTDDYKLTNKGLESANTKCLWVGHTGVFDIYVAEGKLIKIEIPKQTANDFKNNEVNLPTEFGQFVNTVVKHNDGDIRIIGIEQKCYKLSPVKGLEYIESEKAETNLILKDSNNNVLYTEILQNTEKQIVDNIILQSTSLNYNDEIGTVLTEYNGNTSFYRDIHINKATFNNKKYEAVTLEKIMYLPVNQEEGCKWYLDLLCQNINTYFYSNEEFFEFAMKYTKEFEALYNFKVTPNIINVIANQLLQKENNFYKLSKIQAINILNF
jgi:hypothetical protein